jgi:MFS family permease
MIASFVINLGYSAIEPTFPFLVLALKGLISEIPENIEGVIVAHQGALEFGILMAAFMLTRAPAAGLSGFLSDVFGRKKTIVYGMAMYLIVWIGFIISNEIWVLVLFRALQGIASAMVWPVAEAYLADISPQWKRGKVISSYTATMTVGEIIGPGIGVAIYKFYIVYFGKADILMAFKSPIVFLAIMSLASLMTLFLIPEIPRKANPEDRKRRKMISGMKEVVEILKTLPSSVSRSIKTIYVNGLINGVGMGILSSIVIVYVIEFIVKDPLYIGLFTVVISLVTLPIMLFSGYISDRTKRRKPFIVLGYFLGRGAFFVIPFVRDYTTLMAVGIIAGLSFSMAMPIMRALQADLVSSDVRGTIFGLQQLFFNSGIFAGALFGGWLANTFAGLRFKILSFETTGYLIPFWISGILGITTALLFTLYVEERAPKVKPLTA